MVWLDRAPPPHGRWPHRRDQPFKVMMALASRNDFNLSRPNSRPAPDAWPRGLAKVFRAAPEAAIPGGPGGAPLHPGTAAVVRLPDGNLPSEARRSTSMCRDNSCACWRTRPHPMRAWIFTFPQAVTCRRDCARSSISFGRSVLDRSGRSGICAQVLCPRAELVSLALIVGRSLRESVQARRAAAIPARRARTYTWPPPACSSVGAAAQP